MEGLEDRVVPTVPLPPTGLSALGASASAITLRWNASSDPSVTGYDVIEKVWIKGGYKRPGHYAYNLVANNLTTHSDTITGLAPGSTHTYYVTARNASGPSLYSVPAIGETWIAPSFMNGPNFFLLSSGAVWSSPVNATAGLTTQISLLVSGNPLHFSVVSGPSTVSIDQHGVVTYTPAASEVGPVNVTFKVSNSLGNITQTVPFNVAPPQTGKAAPTLSLLANTSVYDGQYQQVTGSAVGTDGVSHVSGTFTVAYNGSTGFMHDVGTYPVLLTFTSADPAYADATLLTTYTITKATPSLSGLSSTRIAVGTSSTTVSGFISTLGTVPGGEYVIVKVAGMAQAAPISANGQFSTTLDTSQVPLGRYTISYTYPGDSNLKAAPARYTTLTVVPTAPPTVTANPVSHTISVGDGVSFTAAAKGSPVPAVQWQVSTDGGLTFTDITGNTSAQTTTLSFIVAATENGYRYRAVFTNPYGVAISTAATLHVDPGD